MTNILCLQSSGAAWSATGAGRCLGNIRIQKINADGDYLTKYSYYSTKQDGVVKGWMVGYPDPTEKATNVSFKNGEGMIIECDKDAGAAFQFSGEVSLSDGCVIAKGWSFVGNYTPVKINLKDVECLQTSGSPWSATGAGRCLGNVRIQKINTDGDYLTKYSYYSTKTEGVVKGWMIGYPDPTEKALDVEIEPGEGFIVECDKDAGALLKMPNPIK